MSFSWAKAEAGNWSDKSHWTTAPVATGQPFYSLNFNKPGTYITTLDLNDNFSFNQLNLAGNVTFAGTNSLSPTANGPLLPQINQNSMNTVTFAAPLKLTAMTTMGGMDSGSVTFTGVLSGPGGLTKNSLGGLNITNVTNTYSGGTIINNGTISLGWQANHALGTGPLTLNQSGTLNMNRIFTSTPLILNGGTIIPDGGWGNNFSGPVTLNSNTTINADDNIGFSGNISGAGGFTKTGNSTMNLTGTNSFTGASTIKAGTLQCTNPDALGTGSLDIREGAKVALNYTGTRTIAALTFKAGAAQAPGTYGSTASPATNQNDTYFSGTGTVTILSATTRALPAAGSPSAQRSPPRSR